MWCGNVDCGKILDGRLWYCHDIGILVGYVWIAVLDFEQGTKSHQIKTAHLGGLFYHRITVCITVFGVLGTWGDIRLELHALVKIKNARPTRVCHPT